MLLVDVHLLVLVIKEVSGCKRHGPPGGVLTLSSIATQDNLYHKLEIGRDIKPRKDREIGHEERSRYRDLEVGFILLPKQREAARWEAALFYVALYKEPRQEAVLCRRGKYIVTSMYSRKYQIFEQ